MQCSQLIVTGMKLDIFKSLFKGREDIFAIHWEKDGKAGYMPAYDLNWQEYAKHKAMGGSLKDYSDKNYVPLSDEKLHRHLSLITGQYFLVYCRRF